MLVVFFTVLISLLFSIFSTIIISYVAMATPIGPWMEMTLVLLGTIMCKTILASLAQKKQTEFLALATAAGGIGGAVAMACAFSFPTLFFLNTPLFNSWVSAPIYFCVLLASLVIVAGNLGFYIAKYFQQRLFADSTMTFPIGQMVYTMIATQNQIKKAWHLIYGALLATVYSVITTFNAWVPARITLLPALEWYPFEVPYITTRMDMVPMFWAIGFTTGHVIALPLLVAIIARILLIDPLHTVWFSSLSHSDYILAFGAGMALQGAILVLFDMPKVLHKTIKKISFTPRITNTRWYFNSEMLRAGILLLTTILFLSLASFSLLSQCYLLIFTIVCTYQLLVIAGKLGIAPLGRFATFVMIPGLLLFRFGAFQITLLATFVELVGVVAVDALFGQKVAQLAGMDEKKMQRYQLLGLIASALSIGIIFLLLINHFGLGSAELIASRAQSRALLVQAFNFNYLVLLLGFAFSYSLKFIKVNPTLVFGGLLMGFDTSLMLVAGGLSTYLVKNKEEHYPFWSGIYAASSLWIFIKMLW